MKIYSSIKIKCIIASLACLFITNQSVAGIELSPQIEISNQLVVRGFSYTDNQPTLQASLSYDISENFFLGAEGFSSSSNDENGIFRGASAHMGWFHSFGNNQAIQLSLERNQFFGKENIIWPYAELFVQYQAIDDSAQTWSYTELRVDYHYSRKLSFSLMYSDDYLGRLTDAYLVESNWVKELTDHFSLQSTAGYIHAGTEQIFDQVVYASTGVHFSTASPWGAHLTAHHGNRKLEQALGDEPAGLNIVFGITYQF